MMMTWEMLAPVGTQREEAAIRIKLPSFNSIYDDPMLALRTEHREGKASLQTTMCRWCEKTFRFKNATKMVYHLAKIKGGDVVPCPAMYWPRDDDFQPMFDTNGNIIKDHAFH